MCECAQTEVGKVKSWRLDSVRGTEHAFRFLVRSVFPAHAQPAGERARQEQQVHPGGITGYCPMRGWQGTNPKPHLSEGK